MRTRIVSLAVLGSILAIALFGLPLAAALAQYGLAEEKARLEEQASTIATETAPDLNEGRAPTRPIYIRPGTQVAVFDSDRDQVHGVTSEGMDDDLIEAFNGRASIGRHGPQLVAAVPVSSGKHLVGAVHVSSPVSAVYRRLALVWAAMIGLAALAIGTVWLVARRQARRLAQPLETLSRGARRLGDGDFSVHVAAISIPEIDSVSRALNSTAERLDDLLSRERAFSAEASHQIRTPLTGLRLRLEAALEAPSLEPAATVRQLRTAVADAIGDADRVERTVAELLALARRTRASHTDPLDLDGLLVELRAGWRQRPAADDRELLVLQERDLPESSASMAAVRQVLTVLLDNAAVHGAGTVTLRVRDAGNALAIDVCDQGAGIIAGEAELFTRRPHRDGHGIGLPLAQRLTEAEGGRLRLTSPAPTTFSVLLPTSAYFQA